jgi:bile acid-coenzyme A ligase
MAGRACDGIVPGRVVSEPVAFLDALAVHERRDPDRVAVICDGQRLTRGEFARRSIAVAAELRARGVVPDRIVAIVLPNSVDLFVTVVAAWRLGAMAMPLSHRLPGPELDAVLAVAEPACVVREPIVVGHEPATPLPDVPLRRWKAMATGGSTGVPKVVIDEAQPLVDPFGAQNHMRVDGVMLVGGPMYHSGPFINAVRGLLCGSTVVVLSRFDPERARAGRGASRRVGVPRAHHAAPHLAAR